ncbi:MAG: hypothetical protein R2746_00785 [Acidimicrobiales bacterium]
MGIVDEDVARVRETADIIAVISAHTTLKKVGSNWSGSALPRGEVAVVLGQPRQGRLLLLRLPGPL